MEEDRTEANTNTSAVEVVKYNFLKQIATCAHHMVRKRI